MNLNIFEFEHRDCSAFRCGMTFDLAHLVHMTEGHVCTWQAGPMRKYAYCTYSVVIHLQRLSGGQHRLTLCSTWCTVVHCSAERARATGGARRPEYVITSHDRSFGASGQKEEGIGHILIERGIQ